MNCRDVTPLIHAERDGTLDNLQRAALADHVAHCDACSRERATLAGAIDGWRAAVQNVRVPDAELEWQKLRREIRGGAGSRTAAREAKSSRFAWFALPLATAAAVAVAFFVMPSRDADTSAGAAPQVARATAGHHLASDASAVVFVDDKSGWVFVVDDDAKTL